MSDGTPTLDSGSEQPVNDAPIAEPETTDPGLPVEAAPEAPPIIDESEEIEFDGEKYKVPKKLKDGFLMQSDYTRKTQTLAQERTAVEAEKKAVKEHAEATQAHVKDVGRVMILNEQLAEYDKVDWQQLEKDDPFKADALFRQRTFLREQRDGLAQQVQANEWKRSQDTQQSFAKRYAETNETLAKDIKGWNQDTANKLRDFAIANGATEDDIRTFAVNAPLVKLLHRAWLGDQVINKQQAAAKTAEPKIELKPLAKVSGVGARPAIDLSKADMESYVAERKKQGFGKR